MRTSELALAAEIHPNTVRAYEEWGFLPTPRRTPKGYRIWTEAHREQLLFAREALHGFWPGPRIRRSAVSLVKLAAARGPAHALGAATDHLRLVRKERARAKAAARFLDSWAASLPDRGGSRSLSAREAAEAVDASPDQIRNWERNRLVRTPRDPGTGRRVYGAEEIGRLRVVRSLLLAGYSVSAILRMCLELERGRGKRPSSVLDAPREGEDVLTAFDRWQSSLAQQERRARKLLSMLAARSSR